MSPKFFTNFLPFFCFFSQIPHINSLTCPGPNTHPFLDNGCLHIVKINSSTDERGPLNDQCQQFDQGDQKWHLPKLDTKAKNEKLDSIFRTLFPIGGKREVFRLGLIRGAAASREEAENKTRWADPSKWIWWDGTTLKSSFPNDAPPWFTGEPNNAGHPYGSHHPEACVGSYFDGRLPLKWNDIPCDYDYRMATAMGADMILVCETSAKDPNQNGEECGGNYFAVGLFVGMIVIGTLIGVFWFGRRRMREIQMQRIGESFVNLAPPSGEA